MGKVIVKISDLAGKSISSNYFVDDLKRDIISAEVTACLKEENIQLVNWGRI